MIRATDGLTMKLQIHGKQIDIGQSLRRHVEASLDSAVDKYFGDAVDATTTFSREGRMYRAEISVHPLRGLLVQGGGTAADAYAAFDAALERVAKQLRRAKRRMRNHHQRPAAKAFTRAQQYVLAQEPDTEPADGKPVIVAELATEIATLTVGEAVARLDLTEAPAVMFKNRAHGGLNVVYRRRDGAIGWVDPSGSRRA